MIIHTAKPWLESVNPNQTKPARPQTAQLVYCMPEISCCGSADVVLSHPYGLSLCAGEKIKCNSIRNQDEVIKAKSLQMNNHA